MDPLRQSAQNKMKHNIKKKIIRLFLAALGPHCRMQAFPSCGEQGLLSSCSAAASHFSGFSCCGAQALGHVRVQ